MAQEVLEERQGRTVGESLLTGVNFARWLQKLVRGVPARTRRRKPLCDCLRTVLRFARAGAVASMARCRELAGRRGGEEA